ncbi:3656_t:CDS:2, partial [Funneliformis geosporum]
EEINANDYNISFKSEKAQGASTLLVDESYSNGKEVICDESIPKISNLKPPLQPSSSSMFNNSIESQSTLLQQSIPSIAEFLQQIDKTEKMENYYSNILKGFKK